MRDFSDTRQRRRQKTLEQQAASLKLASSCFHHAHVAIVCALQSPIFSHTRALSGPLPLFPLVPPQARPRRVPREREEYLEERSVSSRRSPRPERVAPRVRASFLALCPAVLAQHLPWRARMRLLPARAGRERRNSRAQQSFCISPAPYFVRISARRAPRRRRRAAPDPIDTPSQRASRSGGQDWRLWDLFAKPKTSKTTPLLANANKT